jgi:MFS family permease
VTQGETLSFADRLRDIRTGFERPFWVANISELFERLSYYAAFASLARYLNESLQFPVEKATSLTGLFGGLVWFLAIFGGTLADRLGFRRALSLAYLILSGSYFLLGSLQASWLAPIRNSMPLTLLVVIVLMLPAFGIALVKPSVVGTTARASKENVRSIGYSIYYTLVNIGGFAGPYTASVVHRHLSVENVFRIAALSVFLMFFAVLLFFKEPRRAGEVQATSLAQSAKNFLVVLSNPRFMLFLLIFSGYWIVYWQEFIILPLYVHNYINSKTDTELLLITGPLTVISLQVIVSLLTQKVPSFRAITLGTFISALAWVILIIHPTVHAFCCFARRNHSVPPVLRIHLTACAGRTAGDLYGFCISANRHWRVYWWGLWWTADASFRRGHSSACTHLVGGHGRGCCHRPALMDL